jgi:hypothetical protein
MPSLSEHDNDPPPTRSTRSLLLPAMVVAVVLIFVLLHLTGVLGSGSH